MIWQDLHVHTTYCDGKNTPEEMVLAAIDKGLVRLGFSGHAYQSFDQEPSMSIEGTAAYRTVEGQWNARVAAKRLVALAQMLTEQTDSGPAFPDGPCSPVTGRKEKEK